MSGRRFLFLSLGAALLVLLTLATGLWLSVRRSNTPEIVLPEPLPSGLWPGLVTEPTPPGAPYAAVTLTTTRARALLTTLKQPKNYSRSVQTVLYWEGGYQNRNYTWYIRDGMSRVDTKDENGQTQVRLFTGTSLYDWTEGIYYRKSPFSGMRPEELIGTPTLETLLALSEEWLVSVEYIDDARLRFITRERYYNGEYIISLEEGVLELARYTDNEGQRVYQCITLLRSLEAPDASLFLLPNGEKPE